ncbi:hypothetical protein HGT71_00050 [Rosenbergiella epipactidis]|nr:hypothetical protein [Rosenbergiella epipactidis]
MSDGTIIINDSAKQQQNVDDLSRDVAHANQTLSPIFDKEKEQQRMQTLQLIGEIGNQAADIARTQGEIAGLKAQSDPAALEAARAELMVHGNSHPTSEQVAKQAYQNAKATFGTGSAIQQAITASTAAIQGLAGGDIAKALAGGAAPYLAEEIHKRTTTGDKVNIPANLMAHAVVNAALSLAKGENALAGASSAVTAEAVGLISEAYYDKKPSELDESQKQTISALASLAAGLAGGLVGGDTASAVSGMQTGKVTVENNALANVLAAAEANKKGTIENYLKAQKAVCKGNQAACTQMVKDVAGTGLDFVPIVGDIKGFVEAQTAIDYLAAALGVIPGAGDVAGKAIKAAETALKKGDVAEASKLINKASDDVTSVSYFRQERKYWSAEPVNINGNKVYQRNDLFDPKYIDPKSGKTNLELMKIGRAPVGKDGKPVNLHHMLQKQDGPIAEVTQSFHKDNHSVIHINDNSVPSGINRTEFNKWRSDYWKQRANDFK